MKASETEPGAVVRLTLIVNQAVQDVASYFGFVAQSCRSIGSAAETQRHMTQAPTSGRRLASTLLRPRPDKRFWLDSNSSRAQAC